MVGNLIFFCMGFFDDGLSDKGVGVCVVMGLVLSNVLVCVDRWSLGDVWCGLIWRKCIVVKLRLKCF